MFILTSGVMQFPRGIGRVSTNVECLVNHSRIPFLAWEKRGPYNRPLQLGIATRSKKNAKINHFGYQLKFFYCIFMDN